MKQITFSDMEYGNSKRTTKREEFLDIMEEIIPWEEQNMCDRIIPMASVGDRPKE